MTTSGQIGTFDPSILDTLTITGTNQIQPLTASSYPWTITGLSVDTETYQGQMVVAEITVTDTDAVLTGMSAGVS